MLVIVILTVWCTFNTLLIAIREEVYPGIASVNNMVTKPNFLLQLCPLVHRHHCLR